MTRRCNSSEPSVVITTGVAVRGPVRGSSARSLRASVMGPCDVRAGTGAGAAELDTTNHPATAIVRYILVRFMSFSRLVSADDYRFRSGGSGAGGTTSLRGTPGPGAG